MQGLRLDTSRFQRILQKKCPLASKATHVTKRHGLDFARA